MAALRRMASVDRSHRRSSYAHSSDFDNAAIVELLSNDVNIDISKPIAIKPKSKATTFDLPVDTQPVAAVTTVDTREPEELASVAANKPPRRLERVQSKDITSGNRRNQSKEMDYKSRRTQSKEIIDNDKPPGIPRLASKDLNSDSQMPAMRRMQSKDMTGSKRRTQSKDVDASNGANTAPDLPTMVVAGAGVSIGSSARSILTINTNPALQGKAVPPLSKKVSFTPVAKPTSTSDATPAKPIPSEKVDAVRDSLVQQRKKLKHTQSTFYEDDEGASMCKRREARQGEGNRDLKPELQHTSSWLSSRVLRRRLSLSDFDASAKNAFRAMMTVNAAMAKFYETTKVSQKNQEENDLADELKSLNAKTQTSLAPAKKIGIISKLFGIGSSSKHIQETVLSGVKTPAKPMRRDRPKIAVRGMMDIDRFKKSAVKRHADPAKLLEAKRIKNMVHQAQKRLEAAQKAMEEEESAMKVDLVERQRKFKETQEAIAKNRAEFMLRKQAEADEKKVLALEIEEKKKLDRERLAIRIAEIEERRKAEKKEKQEKLNELELKEKLELLRQEEVKVQRRNYQAKLCEQRAYRVQHGLTLKTTTLHERAVEIRNKVAALKHLRERNAARSVEFVEQNKLKNEEGNTMHLGADPFMKACRVGDTKAVVALLKAHENEKGYVDRRDGTGSTGLFKACWGGHFDVVEKLLNAGANVNARNLRKNTALHFALEQGNISIARLLISRKCNTKAENWDGRKCYSIHNLNRAEQNVLKKFVRICDLLYAFPPVKWEDLPAELTSAGFPSYYFPKHCSTLHECQMFEDAEKERYAQLSLDDYNAEVKALKSGGEVVFDMHLHLPFPDEEGEQPSIPRLLTRRKAGGHIRQNSMMEGCAFSIENADEEQDVAMPSMTEETVEFELEKTQEAKLAVEVQTMELQAKFFRILVGEEDDEEDTISNEKKKKERHYLLGDAKERASLDEESILDLWTLVINLAEEKGLDSDIEGGEQVMNLLTEMMEQKLQFASLQALTDDLRRRLDIVLVMQPYLAIEVSAPLKRPAKT